MKSILFTLLIITLVNCSPVKRESKPTAPEIFNQGVRIDYNISGEGDTTLFFVHGWCIDQSYWNKQVEYFSDSYKVVTIDLPGHGKSGSNRQQWSIERFGSDVVMVMDALDLNNVVLIGHSMGGNIILEAANKRQGNVIGFVGVDNFKDVGVEYSDEQVEEMEEFISMIKEDYRGVSGGFASGMLFHESTSEEIKQAVMEDVINAQPEIAVPILESLIWSNAKERGLMQQLSLKVNLINSDATPTNEISLKKYCAHSYQIHSVGLTGHYPMAEDPDRFNKILEGILKTL